jgi:threonine aldolase
MNKKLDFASDNYSGICPVALDYLQKANAGVDYPYGDDQWTRKAADSLRGLFQTENCEVFFVFNGTAANALALAALCQSYHSVICHELAHIETDECGAPEFASNGSKLLLVGGNNGKLDLTEVEQTIVRRRDIHYPKPKVISLTQTTEVGTVYSVEEVRSIGALARQYGLRVHMDGARFANAVACLGVSPADITWRSGVDVLCFSGTKNGMPYGEAILFFDRKLAEDFAYRCKQAGQLASKMRFIAAPWFGMIHSGVWLENAQHSNDAAAYLAAQLAEIEGIRLMFPREANAVFVEIGVERTQKLSELGWHFYTFIGLGGARLMCNWSTGKREIDDLVRDLKTLF